MSEKADHFIGDVNAAGEFRRGAEFVEKVFVKHSGLVQVVRDEKDLLLGLKGSGKSMLFRVLLELTHRVQEWYADELYVDAWKEPSFRRFLRTPLMYIVCRLLGTTYRQQRLRVKITGSEGDQVHEVVLAGLDLKSPDSDVEKARLEEVAEAALREARRRPKTEVCTSSVRSEWLKVIARVALQQLNKRERGYYVRFDHWGSIGLLLTALWTALVCFACYKLRDLLPTPTSFWNEIRLWAHAGYAVSLSVLFFGAWLLEVFHRLLGFTICNATMIRHMVAAGVTTSRKPLPALLWLLGLPLRAFGASEFFRHSLGVSWVLEKIEYKGIHVRFFTATDDPAAVLADIDEYLQQAQLSDHDGRFMVPKRSRDRSRPSVFMVFLVDNLEHVVDLRARERAMLLIEEFCHLLDGFELCYSSIRIKTFIRTDLAASATFSDRTQMACRFDHVRWRRDEDLEDILKRRLKKEWRDKELIAIIRGTRVDEILTRAAETLPGLCEAATELEDAWELLKTYLRDAFNSVEPRFIIRWANSAIDWAKAGPAEKNYRAEVTPDTFIKGVVDLQRYVLDEMSNDYWYIWPQIQELAETVSREGSCSRAVLINALGRLLASCEGSQSKDGNEKRDLDELQERFKARAESEIRRLHYHGLLTTPKSNDKMREPIEAARTLYVPYFLRDVFLMIAPGRAAS